MPSSIPAVYTALEALTGRVLPSAQLIRGALEGYEAPQIVLLGDVSGSDVPYLMGPAPQVYQESYDITITCRWFQGGEDVATAQVKSLAMRDAIRDGIAADPSLGVGGALTATPGSYTSRTGTTTNGVVSETDLIVHVSNLA